MQKFHCCNWYRRPVPLTPSPELPTHLLRIYPWPILVCGPVLLQKHLPLGTKSMPFKGMSRHLEVGCPFMSPNMRQRTILRIKSRRTWTVVRRRPTIPNTRPTMSWCGDVLMIFVGCTRRCAFVIRERSYHLCPLQKHLATWIFHSSKKDKRNWNFFFNR